MAANVKEYAFYIEGSKLCLVERDTQFDNDVNSKDYGPGVHRTQWKSPKSTVADGIELQYTHTADYIIPTQTYGINKVTANAWTIVDNYLCFIRLGDDTPDTSDWSWASVPYSIATSGTAGSTGSDTSDYILVEGNSKWNGVHKVQSAGTDGILKTYTKVSTNLDLPNDSTGSDNWNLITATTAGTDSHIIRNAASGGSMWLSDFFSAGDFIYITNAHERNNGLYEVAKVANSTISPVLDYLYFGGRYISQDNHKENDAAFIVNKGDSLDNFMDESGTTDIAWYKVIYEPNTRITGYVNVLNDEADELPIPPYLSKALVYYVKAKLAEDQGEFEAKEYFMREYKKMTEKYESSLKAGARMISSPGPYAIR